MAEALDEAFTEDVGSPEVGERRGEKSMPTPAERTTFTLEAEVHPVPRPRRSLANLQAANDDGPEDDLGQAEVDDILDDLNDAEFKRFARSAINRWSRRDKPKPTLRLNKARGEEKIKVDLNANVELEDEKEEGQKERGYMGRPGAMPKERSISLCTTQPPARGPKTTLDPHEIMNFYEYIANEQREKKVTMADVNKEREKVKKVFADAKRKEAALREARKRETEKTAVAYKAQQKKALARSTSAEQLDQQGLEQRDPKEGRRRTESASSVQPPILQKLVKASDGEVYLVSITDPNELSDAVGKLPSSAAASRRNSRTRYSMDASRLSEVFDTDLTDGDAEDIVTFVNEIKRRSRQNSGQSQVGGHQGRRPADDDEEEEKEEEKPSKPKTEAEIAEAKEEQKARRAIRASQRSQLSAFCEVFTLEKLLYEHTREEDVKGNVKIMDQVRLFYDQIHGGQNVFQREHYEKELAHMKRVILDRARHTNEQFIKLVNDEMGLYARRFQREERRQNGEGEGQEPRAKGRLEREVKPGDLGVTRVAKYKKARPLEDEGSVGRDANGQIVALNAGKSLRNRMTHQHRKRKGLHCSKRCWIVFGVILGAIVLVLLVVLATILYLNFYENIHLPDLF